MNQINDIRKQLLDEFGSPNLTAFSREQKNSSPISRDLAQQIDSTLLHPTTTYDDIAKLCADAIEYGFYSVCVAPSFVMFASDLLTEKKILPITVIGFPHGNATTETKTFETLDAIDWGAKELDVVINISKLKSGKREEVFQDLLSVIQQADATPVKVILETSLLTTEEKITGAILAEIAGARFVKTSTGFATGGATIEDVHLLKQVVGSNVGIKASGGIKNYASAMSMIQAGATRIGTSNGVAIMKEKNGN